MIHWEAATWEKITCIYYRSIWSYKTQYTYYTICPSGVNLLWFVQWSNVCFWQTWIKLSHMTRNIYKVWRDFIKVPQAAYCKWSIFRPVAPMFTGNMSGTTQITHRWYSHSSVVKHKACSSRCLYVPNPVVNRPTFSFHLLKQRHHHNGDQAVRRPHMMCSICVRRFTTPLFGVRWDRDELIR